MQRRSVSSPWNKLPVLNSNQSSLEPGSARRRLSLRARNTVTSKTSTPRRRLSLCSDFANTPKLAPAGSAAKLTGKENHALFSEVRRVQKSRNEFSSPSVPTAAGILVTRNLTDSQKGRANDGMVKTLKRTQSSTDFDFNLHSRTGSRKKTKKRDDFDADSKTDSRKKTGKRTRLNIDKSAKRRLSGDFHDRLENFRHTDENASPSIGRKVTEKSMCQATDFDASLFSPKISTFVRNPRLKKCLFVWRNDNLRDSLNGADVTGTQKCVEEDQVNTTDIRARRSSISSAQTESTPSITTTPSNGLQCPPMVPPFPKEIKVIKRRTIALPLELKKVVVHEVPPEVKFTTEYIDDIVNFYAEKESSYKLSKYFPEDGNMCPDRRRIVVNFMINIHAFLSKETNVIYQAVKMFDAYLDARKNVPLSELQLIAIAAMWIAIKRGSSEFPSAKQMISLAKNKYQDDTDLLKACERDILKTLNFNIAYADPLSLLAHHLLSIELYNEPIIETVHYCASYLIDVSLLNEKLIRTPADLLAATAAATSLCLVNEEEKDLHNPEWSSWKLDSMSKYSKEELGSVRRAMIQGVLGSVITGSSTAAVYKKYMLERYGKVSEFLVGRVKMSTSSATIGHD